jgi:hypothetical protein
MFRGSYKTVKILKKALGFGENQVLILEGVMMTQLVRGLMRVGDHMSTKNT